MSDLQGIPTQKIQDKVEMKKVTPPQACERFELQNLKIYTSLSFSKGQSSSIFEPGYLSWFWLLSRLLQKEQSFIKRRLRMVQLRQIRSSKVLGYIGTSARPSRCSYHLPTTTSPLPLPMHPSLREEKMNSDLPRESSQTFGSRTDRLGFHIMASFQKKKNEIGERGR